MTNMPNKSNARLLAAAILTLTLAIPGNAAAQATAKTKRDPLWEGMLIGAGVGVLVGMVVAPRAICDLPDPECDAIVKVVIGLPAIGVGIGLGALADSLHHQSGIGPKPFQSARSLNLNFRF
jgi:hypothetical protein